MAKDLNNILLSEIEKNKIKEKTPDKLPLNPTAEGWSGHQVRRFLAKSLIDNEGSILSEFDKKMIEIKAQFEDVFGDGDGDIQGQIDGKQDKLIAGDNINIVGNTISAGYNDSEIVDYVLTADDILVDGLNRLNNVDLEYVRDTFHPEDIITVSNIKIGNNIRLRVNRPDGGYTEYGLATIIGYLDEAETVIQIIVKKFSGSTLNSELQFLTIGTIIRHPDYPNNIYVNTTAGHFSLSRFEDALNANVVRLLNVNADWNASSGDAQILNKPTLETVATSGSYNDLKDKLVAGNNITIDENTNVISSRNDEPDGVTILLNEEGKLKVSKKLEIDGGFL